jgi:hypothetical protein
LVDQKAPPAGLIAIATRSLPVGAIWSFKASALAGIVVIAAIPRMRPAIAGKDDLIKNGLNIGYSSPCP